MKISDFGISKALDNSIQLSNTHVGTCRYMSPERLNGLNYDKSADIWSVGIMMVELWTGQYPFSHCCTTPVELVSELEHLDFETLLGNSKFPRRMQRFVGSMLALEPQDRPSASELIHADWFNSFGLFSLDIAQQV